MSALKLSGRQGDYVVWVGLGLGAVALAYVLVKYVLPKLAGAAATGTADTLNSVNQGLGNNDLTNSQTDFGGDSVDYSGHGILSTLGAEVNALTGGLASSIGEAIGSSIVPSGYHGYSYSTSLNRWTQVQDNGGTIYNLDANGNITGPA
jgi:hypothetical protein